MKKGALPTSEKLRVLYNVSIGVKKITRLKLEVSVSTVAYAG
jgi:hypothetical protein